MHFLRLRTKPKQTTSAPPDQHLRSPLGRRPPPSVTPLPGLYLCAAGNLHPPRLEASHPNRVAPSKTELTASPSYLLRLSRVSLPVAHTHAPGLPIGIWKIVGTPRFPPITRPNITYLARRWWIFRVGQG